MTVYRVRKTLPYIKISASNFRLSRLKFLLGNGLWFTIGGLAGLFIFRLDSLLIGKYISLEIVASFLITSKLYMIADVFHKQVFNTTRPFFSQEFGKGNFFLLKSMYNVSFISSFVFAYFLGIVILLLNEWFIGIWVGEEFYLGNELNILLCLSFIMQSAVLPNRILLASTLYKNNLHAISRLSEGILKLILSIFLIHKLGINIIVISGIAASFIFSNTFLNFLSCKFMDENFWKKMILFLFLLPIILAAFCQSNTPLNISILFVSFALLLFYSLDKLKKDKDLLNPIYVSISKRIFKK
jgi:O-antigen/teichoic acid export membrane protein